MPRERVLRPRYALVPTILAALPLLLLGCEGGEGGSDEFSPQPGSVNLNNVTGGPPQIVILSVTPDRGPTTGGTQVTIQVANLDPASAALVTGATLGGAPLTNLVVTPPGVAGGPTILTGTVPALTPGTDPSSTLVLRIQGIGNIVRTDAFGFIQVLTDPAPTGTGLDDFGGTLLRVGTTTSGANAPLLPGMPLAVGDFDGDGVDDLAVGAPGKRVSGNFRAGEVIVFLGTAGGTLFAPGAPTNPVREPVPEAGAFFGFAIAAGDVDGDGDDDLLVGAPGATADGVPTAGEAFLFLSDGLTPPNFVFALAVPNPSPELHGASGRQGGFGFSVALADLDVDGDLDVVIGEPDASDISVGALPPQPESGAIHAFETVLFPFSLVLRDSETQGTQPGRNLGTSLAVGDVNPNFNIGISFPDVIIGQPGFFANGIARDGGVLIAFSDGGAAGGFFSVPGVEIGAQAQDFAGDASVIVATDFDLDGRIDLVTGRPFFDAGGFTDVGEARVLLAQPAGGLGPAPFLLPDPAPAGTNRFGFAVSAGDIDGDGRPDVITGIPGLVNGALPAAGGVATFLNTGVAGAPFGNPALATETLLDPFPAARGQLGTSIAVGDFNADGLADIAVAAPDPGGANLASDGRVLVFYSIPR